MSRLMSGFLVALLASVGTPPTDTQPTPPAPTKDLPRAYQAPTVRWDAADLPVVIIIDENGDTVIVNWCEINPWDILCWLVPVAEKE